MALYRRDTDTMLDTTVAQLLSNGVLTLFLVWLSKTWLSERLRHSIAHEYAQLLEKFKLELSAEHAISLERSRAEHAQARALRAVGEDYLREAARVAHAKRIDAIQSLWSSLLDVTAAVPEVVVFGDVLATEELAALPSKSPPPPMLDKLTDQHLALIFRNSQRAGEARLMAGESLYSLYEAYCVVLGRAVHLAISGRKAVNLTQFRGHRKCAIVRRKVIHGKEKKTQDIQSGIQS